MPMDRAGAMPTAELMREVRRLHIRTRRRVNDLFAGDFRSAFKGRGMEFADVREYEPGDEVRAIDWNVTARTGRPFIKRFFEERELTVIVAADLSASGGFGSAAKLKSTLIVETCAALAAAANQARDKVGLMIFTDRVEHFVPPAKGQKHTMRIMRDLLAFRPRGRGTDIAQGLDYLGRVLRRRSLVFLASDFVTAPTARSGLERSLRMLDRRHEVVAISVRDPRERELPPVGLVTLEDPETGQVWLVDTSPAPVRARYAAAAREDEAAVAAMLARAGVKKVSLSTDRPFIPTLDAFFRAMNGRVRGAATP
jgi:uncharacterized protein (DUF58 family)